MHQISHHACCVRHEGGVSCEGQDSVRSCLAAQTISTTCPVLCAGKGAGYDGCVGW
jgi:hypothetical protein